MGWLVAHLIPSDVEVIRAASFSEADRCLREQPPDAAIFNLMPRHLDWRTLLDRCVRGQRVVPYLCCSAIDNDEERDGPLPCRPEDFLHEVYFAKGIYESSSSVSSRSLGADEEGVFRDTGSVPELPKTASSTRPRHEDDVCVRPRIFDETKLVEVGYRCGR